MDQAIANIRTTLEHARQALGPESQRILENAQMGTGGRGRLANTTTVKALEVEGLRVRMPPEVYLLLALEQLTDLVAEALAGKGAHT